MTHMTFFIFLSVIVGVGEDPDLFYKVFMVCVHHERQPQPSG